MLKATFLEGTIAFSIQPAGPILIKAGESGGTDPALPDMEFVRTRRVVAVAQEGQEQGKGTVYLPGSSLKGVIRAQCERICRSLDREDRNPKNDDPPLADNPQGDGKEYKGPNDMAYSSGAYFNAISNEIKGKSDRTAQIYRQSSFVSQMFGHTSLAGRVRFADAYPDPSTPLKIEERNGVAIDRIYGSVAHGPFNYETVVEGSFTTHIAMKNITLAQLGLLGLALRDLGEGRVGIGFGKSRGLGRVGVVLERLELYYPTCRLDESGNLVPLRGEQVAGGRQFVGIGALYQNTDYSTYKFPKPADDTADLPEGIAYQEDALMGVRLIAVGNEQVRALLSACMVPWKVRIDL